MLVTVNYEDIKDINNTIKNADFSFETFVKILGISSGSFYKFRCLEKGQKISVKKDIYNKFLKIRSPEFKESLKAYEDEQMMLITNDIKDKIKFIKNNMEKAAEEIFAMYGLTQTQARQISQNLKKTKRKNLKIICQICNDIKTGKINAESIQEAKKKLKKSNSFEKFDLKTVEKRERIEQLKQNKEKEKKLYIGCTYKFDEFKSYKSLNTNVKKLEGKVIKEYRNFYLVDCGNFKTTILKNDLYGKGFSIERI